MSATREDNLNESWVEVAERRGAPGGSPVPAKPPNAAMEKLLLEAQKESSSDPSRTDSPASSKASTKSSDGEHAPCTDTPPGDVELMRELKGKDWVWDWSSRPEAVALSSTEPRTRHPIAQRCRTSIRNTRLFSGLVHSMEGLPLLLLTHACSFLLGATTMFFCLRRYGSWSTTTMVSAA